MKNEEGVGAWPGFDGFDRSDVGMLHAELEGLKSVVFLVVYSGQGACVDQKEIAVGSTALDVGHGLELFGAAPPISISHCLFPT